MVNGVLIILMSLLKNSFSFNFNMQSALLLGVFQSIAILPGISRSGMVISSAIMLGLNKEILCQYVEYITDVRVKAVGIDPIFNVTKNPIPWMKTWLASDTVQVAPQEVEISSYLVGQVDSEVNVEDLGDFEL